ncbi:methionine aminopeptidase [Klebsormidium nitens]|uniref:Methionine aminopeptidase n=1 Tax=Klebsormidium nitens TaxID=105231 RepID=A0A1Y1IKD9_KLENI|nr:methionine aminopeptidase [Klebsormidium nitens]|eukprot:GAQ88558.1 methionine aminopeptidase [Klebsormidium nitens]
MASMTSGSLRCASSLRLQLAGPASLQRIQDLPPGIVVPSALCLTSARVQRRELSGSAASDFANGAQLLQESTERPREAQRSFMVTARKFGLMELMKPTRERGPGSKRLERGQVSPTLVVPPNIPRPSYAESGVSPPFEEDHLQIHDAEGIKRMRAAGKLAAEVRDYAGTLVKPGVTTDSIDKAVHKMIIEAGAYPSPLNYGRFPKSVCTSVNECICHGIPDSRPLEDGDIINIDVTVFLNGYHGDTSATFFCGNVAPEARRLVAATKEALDAAIAICAPGVPYNKIGKTIHAIGDKYKLGVVHQYIGHGVGQIFHSGPTILHNRNNKPGVMVKNQTFTIEPMFTLGGVRDRVWSDNWTSVTVDGSWSAQFEHTLLITDNGVEILTAP